MNWQRKRISELLTSDPLTGVTDVLELNQVWSTIDLTEADWKQFEDHMIQFRAKNSEFFDSFVKNLTLYIHETGKILKITNWLNEHLKMWKLDHQGPKVKTVQCFGSAMLLPTSERYQLAAGDIEYVVNRFRKEEKIELVIGSGGGGGYMQAANEGARKSGAKSLGFKIYLDIEFNFENKFNSFVEFGTVHDRFDTRIPSLQSSGSSVISFPGGLGTYQEDWSYISLWALRKNPKVNLVFDNQDGSFNSFFEWIDKILVNKYGYLEPAVRNQMNVSYSKEQLYKFLLKNIKSYRSQHTKQDSNFKVIQDLLMPYWNRLTSKKVSEPEVQETKNKDLLPFKTIYENLTPEQSNLKGAINILVKHTIEGSAKSDRLKNIENAYHTINEVIFSELEIKKLQGQRAITFITPRGKISPEAKEELKSLQKIMGDIKSPIAFNHHDETVHELLKFVPNHDLSNQVRLIVPTTPNLPQSERPARNHLYLPIKRLFILKTTLIAQSKAMIFTIPTADGMDQLHELWCLIQNNKIKGTKQVELILYGEDWKNLIELYRKNGIYEQALQIPKIFTDAKEMFNYLNNLS